jgi:CRISPR/Cas system-associated exonuclease Cas4 (RecB family)
VPGPFSWSASRHDSFASCRRRYYYSYYAAVDDPEVRRLKKLSALPLWAGSVVHDTIEAFLRSNDTLPSLEEQEALIRSVVHSGMLSSWRESEAFEPGAAAPMTLPSAPGVEGEGGETPREPFRLFEHEYGVAVEQEDKRLVVNTVMRSLKNFFRSETLRRALEVGRARWLAMEDLVSFHVDDVEVMLRMDLAYRDHDGRVVIVDWKTGRGEGRFNEVQVAGYALYAAEQGWVQAPEEISTELNYLVIPKAVRRSVDKRKVDHARSFIRKSAGTMKSLLLDPAQNLARLEDFPMIDRPSYCRRCNFRRLCFPRAPGASPSPGPGAVRVEPEAVAG